MRVSVRIFGEIARTYGRTHSIAIDEKSTVLLVLQKIQENAGFPGSDFFGDWKIGSAELSIIINGKNMNLLNGVQTQVKDGDDLIVMPYAVGG